MNYGNSTELKVDREASKPERTLIQFNISSIPVGATINSASLKLTKLAGNSGINVDVHQVTAEWDEGTGGSGGSSGDASWNERQPGVAWTTAGGDYGLSVATLNIGGNGDYFWDVASIVQDWVNGTSNYGFMLESPDGGGNRSQIFASSENATSANRPELFINYTWVGAGSGDTIVTFAQTIPMCADLDMPAGGGLQVQIYINPDTLTQLGHFRFHFQYFS